MPAAEGERGNRQWLLEPLSPNEVRIHVDVGEGVEITDEARAALDTLVNELQASEVEGFAYRCPELKACRSFACDLGDCLPLTKNPCFAWIACSIGKLV